MKLSLETESVNHFGGNDEPDCEPDDVLIISELLQPDLIIQVMLNLSQTHTQIFLVLPSPQIPKNV